MKLREDILQMLFQAYFDARKHKRSKQSQLDFEWQLEHNIFELYGEITTKKYTPGASICFIVNKPVKREIFAASFRDRVIHHFIFNILYPLVEKELLHDVYSCRKGKGTLFGIKRAQSQMQSCTENYSKNAYVLKVDVSGYFMNMNKDLLYKRLECIIDRNELHIPIQTNLLKYLVHQNIFHDPTTNCKVQSHKNQWIDLPKNKSLFHAKENCGLPIGNLTSQLYGNLYLNDLDHSIKRDLGIQYYGRYVDDLYFIHHDRNLLSRLITILKSRMMETDYLLLHPRKIYLQSVEHGFQFLGVYIKPYCRYIGKRIKDGLYRALVDLYTIDSTICLSKALERIQSYKSMLVHHSCYHYRRGIEVLESYILSQLVIKMKLT